MKVKDFLVSWDFFIALIIGVICWCTFPEVVGGSILKDMYFTVITVLAIIFPIFFAALAIMMSFSDNDFVDFLEEDCIFSQLLSQFSFSIGVQFFTLILALLLYGHVLFNASNPLFGHLKIQVVVFVSLFLYTLIAVYLSTLDAIHYLKQRIKFIRIKYKNKKR